MANQMLVNSPYPTGQSLNQKWQDMSGSIQLAGSAVSTGEPIDFTDLISGVGYNEINFQGNGVHGKSLALVTAFSGDGTTVTATANNNFSVGNFVRFKGCTSAMGVKLNGTTVTVATCSGTQFTFASALTDDGSSEVGMALAGKTVRPALLGPLSSLTATVTALSASGTTLTVTAANAFLPGAGVMVNVATGTLGPKLAGLLLKVIQSTGTAFTATMPSALTGTTGTGTATGGNPPQPFELRFWSALASGYSYQYNETFGTLFVFQNGGFTPAGTISKPSFTVKNGTALANGTINLDADATSANVVGGSGITADRTLTTTSPVGTPTFTGTAVPAGAASKLPAAAYPSGVLADVIKWSARFAK